MKSNIELSEWLRARTKTIKEMHDRLVRNEANRQNISKELDKLMEQNLIIERLKRD